MQIYLDENIFYRRLPELCKTLLIYSSIISTIIRQMLIFNYYAFEMSIFKIKTNDKKIIRRRKKERKVVMEHHTINHRNRFSRLVKAMIIT